MDLLADLTKIGFTEYEAKVYLALLREYPATGYQLSKESGVPRSMVYEALKRLHGRGAALETVEDRATLYRPLPPQILLDRHQEEHERLLQDLEQGLNALYTSVADNRVWAISGRTAVLAYAAKLIREAQTELFLVLTDEDLAALRLDIIAAAERGLEINTLLTGSGALNCGRVAYHPPLESELQGLTATLLVQTDEVEVLIASAAPHHETTATITRNQDLVLIARQFVWMEMFTQRIYAQLGADLLARLDPEDREIFASLGSH
ncbi:MAG: TrmB family transcriptional regulator [Chloroflexi bacterium]|nr:TrmB family transcriptional regulator [Chloroflexota bacterium]MBK6710600.1 TrmB family transcriptional regulator [Chloroflexota bacterium]MBK7917479.1 TrmB family transcriptional regulator [Chloroflexota bacterium]MBP6802667.1 TrmB family transcriptional regulator [Chloroflexota bacterium]MBP7592806.1 TrmB family transcriptional regulator [Chloroflexota bacterium]